MLSRLASQPLRRSAAAWATRLPAMQQAAARLHAGAPSRKEDAAAAAAPAEVKLSDKLLADPFVRAGIAVLGACTAIKTDFYILNEETQLLGLFFLFVGTCYQTVGPMIASSIDEKLEQIWQEIDTAQSTLKQNYDVTLSSLSSLSGLDKEIVQLQEGSNQILQDMEAATLHEIRLKMHARMVARLDAMVAAETALQTHKSQVLLARVRKQVLNSVTSPEFRKKSLESAMRSVEEDKKVAGAAKDPVVALYEASFKQQALKLRKAAEKAHPMSKEALTAAKEHTTNVVRTFAPELTASAAYGKLFEALPAAFKAGTPAQDWKLISETVSKFEKANPRA